MKWAAKTTGLIVLGLFILNILLGGDPLGQVTGWLSESTGPDSTRFTDLFLIALLLFAIGYGLRFLKKEGKAAFGKGGGGGKAH